MSRVGWIGLGKLGLPCALAMADSGHEVVGADANPEVTVIIALAARGRLVIPWNPGRADFFLQ